MARTLTTSKRNAAGILGGFDPDAQIFFDAVVANGGSLTNEERDSVNVYVINMKEDINEWWTKNLADYPMVGGSAESCAINLRDPSKFNLTFVSTLAGHFTSNGWESTTSSYARTGIVPNVEITQYNIHLEIYSRTQAAGNIDMGSRGSATATRFDMSIQRFGNLRSVHGGGATIVIANADGRGGYTTRTKGAGTLRAFKNGVTVGSAVNTTFTTTAFEFYIGANNNQGAPTSISAREYAGSGIGHGLIDNEVLAQYTARQTMNTSLSRQV